MYTVLVYHTLPKPIRQLPESVIRTISAGQVVEHPASVVKELVENSLDAGATQIRINIKQGGKTRIEIVDNGVGIIPTQLTLAVQPHTTSKISQKSDLMAITSFGFRGEALASIALVSRLVIQTRVATETLGVEIVVNEGEVNSSKTLGMPVGTRVVVEQLFQSIPARKKFLKADATEFKKIVDVVVALALVHPEVGFFLQHNHKVIIDVALGQTTQHRMQLLLGVEMADQVIPCVGEVVHVSDDVSKNNMTLTWTGFLGKPQLADSNKSHQYLYINNRPVRDRYISAMVKKVYGSLLEPMMHPFFLLQLKLEPEYVDVNVHPRKETVVCAHPLHCTLQEHVRKVLEEHNLTYQDTIQHAQSRMWVRDAGMNQPMANTLRQHVTPWQPREVLHTQEHIIQIDKTYLAVPLSSGLIIIDQHAGHERILYEQFLAEYTHQAHGQQAYTLPTPIDIPLTVGQAVLAEQYAHTLQSLGFTITWVDERFLRVIAIPTVLQSIDIAPILRDVITQLEIEPTYSQYSIGIPREVERTLSFLACRSAVKAGDILTQEERVNLVQKLFATNTQYTCPHGRPTYVQLSATQLATLFHR